MSKVTGAIEMEVPDASNYNYVIRQALSAKLRVEAFRTVLLSQGQQRRDVQKVAFEIQVVTERAQMTALASHLKARGAVLSGDIEYMGPQTVGKTWEHVAGQFILRACLLGHQLVNTVDGKFNVNGQCAALPTMFPQLLHQHSLPSTLRMPRTCQM